MISANLSLLTMRRQAPRLPCSRRCFTLLSPSARDLRLYTEMVRIRTPWCEPKVPHLRVNVYAAKIMTVRQERRWMPSKRRINGTMAALFVASLVVAGSAFYLGLSNDGVRQRLRSITPFKRSSQIVG